MAGEVLSLSSVLASAVDYTQFYSILIVLVCLCLMVMFIVRLNGDHFHGEGASEAPGQFIPAQAMVGTNNPFVLQLLSDNQASLQEGAEFRVNCLQPCLLKYYWGASIHELHTEMQQPWPDLQRKMALDELMYGAYLQSAPISLVQANTEEILHVKAKPPLLPEELGSPPRATYPLVVLLALAEAEEFEAEDPSAIVAMVTLIHLKDSLCPGSSHILAQYVKTKQGYIYALQQLYMADTNSVSSSTPSDIPQPVPEEEASDEKVTETSGECIVCQNGRINRVLLPCRHACVCDACFIQLDKCPMCRGQIQFYFSMDEGENSGNNEEEDEETDSSSRWWEDWNQRVNDYMGFT